MDAANPPATARTSVPHSPHAPRITLPLRAIPALRPYYSARALIRGGRCVRAYPRAPCTQSAPRITLPLRAIPALRPYYAPQPARRHAQKSPPHWRHPSRAALAARRTSNALPRHCLAPSAQPWLWVSLMSVVRLLHAPPTLRMASP